MNSSPSVVSRTVKGFMNLRGDLEVVLVKKREVKNHKLLFRVDDQVKFTNRWCNSKSISNEVTLLIYLDTVQSQEKRGEKPPMQVN
jgi:hypothetical protein